MMMKMKIRMKLGVNAMSIVKSNLYLVGLDMAQPGG